MNNLLLIIVVILVAIFLLGTLAMKLRVLSFVSIAQFIVPGIPIALVSGLPLVALPFALIRSRGLWQNWAAVCLMLLIGTQAISLSWSVDVALGLNRMVATCGLLVALLLSQIVIENGIDPLKLVVRASSLVLLVQAASVVAFRLSSELERSYLQSSLAASILGGAATNIFTTAPNNVLSDNKSGGFLFVNANTGSMVLGVALLATAALWLRYRSWRDGFVLIALVVAVISAGSKTATVLLVALPLVGLLLPSSRGSQLKWVFQMLALLSVIIGSAVLLVQSDDADSFSGRSVETLGVRQLIWRHAGDFFLQSPVAGLGFGGWAERFLSYSKSYGILNYPPHNVIIATWGESGIVAALLTVIFFLVILARSLSRIRAAATYAGGVEQALILTALLWLIIHGMGDNTFIYGTTHCIAIFGALAAWDRTGHAQNQVPKLGGVSSIPLRSEWTNHRDPAARSQKPRFMPKPLRAVRPPSTPIARGSIGHEAQN